MNVSFGWGKKINFVAGCIVWIGFIYSYSGFAQITANLAPARIKRETQRRVAQTRANHYRSVYLVDWKKQLLPQTKARSFSVLACPGSCISLPDNPTPVTLVSFTASPLLPNRVKLQWKTASERNSAYFEIERSKDMITKELLETKIPSRSPSGADYELVDANAYPGTSYYRLFQVDQDGRKTVYSWQSVVLDEQAYGVYPNPVQNQQFWLHLDEPQQAKLHLYTPDGKTLDLKKNQSRDRDLQLEVIPTLSPGVYMLEVKERATIRMHRVVVP